MNISAETSRAVQSLDQSANQSVDQSADKSADQYNGDEYESGDNYDFSGDYFDFNIKEFYRTFKAYGLTV
jgi:hypothetical protein